MPMRYGKKTDMKGWPDMEKGCFNWYLKNSGDFVTSMARSIQLADKANLARLDRAFPQMVAAHACDSWDTVPEGFDPVYNAKESL